MNTSQVEFNPNYSFNRPVFRVVSSLCNGFNNTSRNHSEAAHFQCPTSNYTRSTYVSAAVWNMCGDILSELRTINGNGNDGSNAPNQGNKYFQKAFTSYSLSYCNIKNWHEPLKSSIWTGGDAPRMEATTIFGRLDDSMIAVVERYDVVRNAVQNWQPL
jgi:hypothetical protein